MSWQGPYRLGDNRGDIFTNTLIRPPPSAGIYVVSENNWRTTPDAGAQPLYVGRSNYLRSRLGDLLSDMLGFTGDEPLGRGEGNSVIDTPMATGSGIGVSSVVPRPAIFTWAGTPDARASSVPRSS
jgi:hypothetical protein